MEDFPRPLDGVHIGAVLIESLLAVEACRGEEYKKKPIPWALRWKVFQRDGFKCRICGKRPVGYADLHADHIVAERLGGPAVLDNLQTLCRWCNSRKGTKLWLG